MSTKLKKPKSRKRSLKTKIKRTLLDLAKDRHPSMLPIIEALSQNNPLLDELKPGHHITPRAPLPDVSWWKWAANRTVLDPKPDLPIPLIMHCPDCHKRHVDKGEFETKHHHTHSCQFCGFTWRPAVVPTVGVQFLPGFKDGELPTFMGTQIRIDNDMKITESTVK